MFCANRFRSLAIAILALGASVSAASAQGNGGEVLPPSKTPLGYSLEDMAREMAYFDTSYNDLGYYPDTPFQILYTSDTNTFTVKAGTPLFVPVAWFDDSPPVIGDFPDDEDDIAGYVFGRHQIGCHEMQIVVDGKTTTLGAEYAAGTHVPNLLDGGGSNLIQLGAFLTPLSVGKHTVTIRGTFAGDAVVDFFGKTLSFENTYTVTVK